MKKHTEEAYQKNIGLAAANDDLLKLMRDDPCMPRATRRNMEIADETRAEQLKEERMTAADRDARDAARAAHAAKEAAVQKAFKEREAKEREGRKKMAKKLAATQPLTMGTGPVPVGIYVGIVVAVDVASEEVIFFGLDGLRRVRSILVQSLQLHRGTARVNQHLHRFLHAHPVRGIGVICATHLQ